MSNSPIRGISFDAENTLITYRTPTDSANYIAALNAFNEQQQQQDSTKTMIPVPDFPSDSAREKALWTAWDRATQERCAAIGVLADEQQRGLYEQHLKEPWSSSKENLDEFYFLVLKYFLLNLETNAVSAVEEQLRAFTQFLVHDWYTSKRVYQLPTASNNNAMMDNLIELRRRFPHIQLFVVSNTDSRVRKALHLFPEYREAFPAERILTASELPLLKPSPIGIQLAMQMSGVVDFRNAEECKRRWVHVGDDLKCDGGAAAAAGVQFLPCDPVNGVDFAKLLAIVSS